MDSLQERMRKIVAIATSQHTLYTNEYDLQVAVHAALLDAEIPIHREHNLSDGRSRVDLWSPAGYPQMKDALEHGIGIEVKIDSSRADVVRQLTRYALCPEVDGLILVTTRSKHHRIPFTLNGKPVRLASLIGAGL